jgi:hypothetical protein
MHDDLLARFVRTFQQAIREEMAAMRERLGSFEVPLRAGTELSFDAERGRGRYRFELAGAGDKLMAGMDCSLRVAGSEHLVSLESLERATLVLRASRRVATGDGEAVLVVYPWFLYERLIARLGELRCHAHEVERALSLFGKLPHARSRRALAVEHDELNASQLRAVQLCSDSSLAFLWGPPGTGKTHTMAHVVEELLAQGKRLLVLSTTHAAVDQALAQMAARPSIAAAIARGEVLRLGHTEADTHGAGAREVLGRLHGEIAAAIDRARARLRAIEALSRRLSELEARLQQRAAARQTSLFDQARTDSDVLRAPELYELFGRAHATRIAAGPVAFQLAVVSRRASRLRRLRELLLARIAAANRELASRELRLVADARAVMTTLTAAYFSPPLEGQRFDVVLVDEASMAILPSLFYAACLARDKTLMVGDPRQLPPIVQSSSPFVRQAMGRSIFEVTVPEPESSELVVMLDTQYRMHPEIGALVSRLFYSGRLQHGTGTEGRAAIAARAPYPGRALVVVDTAGSTRCATRPGSFSRINRESAALCVRLAADALAAGIASIAVITPYADQAREIRKQLDRLGAAAAQVECSTVHRFQGHERDMVIFDTVDAPPLRPGVLLSGRGEDSHAANLINVSLSRARGKLVVVSDVDHFRTLAPESLVNTLNSAVLGLALGAAAQVDRPRAMD